MKTAIPKFIANMKQSSTLTINTRAAEMAAQGTKVFKLGFGQSPFPIPSFLVEGLKREAHRGEYTSVNGILPLRKAIAEKYSKRDNREVDPQNVLIAPGSKELLYLIQLTCQNASVFMPGPSWVSYPAQAEMIKKQATFIRTAFEDKWKVNPDNLSILREDDNPDKLMILNYPSNPTGQTFSVEEFHAMKSILEETQTVVLCDEIYHEILFNDDEHSRASLAQVLPSQSIISNGFSKSFAAGGWRMGYMVFPDELSHICKSMTSLASETYSCAPTPMQYAALDVYDESSQSYQDLQVYHKKSRHIMKALGAHCTELLNSARVRCHVHAPGGGFYIFPDFHHHMEALKTKKGITSGAELCEHILNEKAVTLLPSSDFRVIGNDIQVRLCFVHFDGAKAIEACDLQEDISVDWLKAHCSDVVTGVERICEWVNELY